MKKGILIGTTLLAGLTVIAASTFAATGTSRTNTLGKTSTETVGVFGGEHRGGPEMRMDGPLLENMTTAERTAFEALSDTEKKAFLEKKRTEMEATRTAHEAVIDKLLAGTALTSDEEAMRQTIIKERAEHKVKEAEMKANMEKMKTIFEKKQAGTALTTEEQALLDSMPKMSGKGGMRGGHGKMMNSQHTPTVQ